MYKLILVTVLSVSTLFSAACTSSESNTASANKAPANSAPANSSPPAANKETEVASATPANKASNAAPTSSADKVGVPECDEYIEKYEACIMTKVPEAMRASYKPAFEQMRESWKKTAANPQAKAALATGCKQALDTAKQSMSSFSCQW